MEDERKQTRCPKCGKDNPDDARFCNSCGCALPNTGVEVKISREAIGSFVCALVTLGCFVPGLITMMDPRVLDPRSNMVQYVACVSILTGGIAVVLGVIALAQIAASGGYRTGYGFAAIGAVIPPVLIFVLAWHGIGGRRATLSHRMVCGTNISGLGKTMLLYPNDYDDALPSAVGPKGRWVSRLPWWAAESRENAYGLSDANAVDGRASVSASLYLLVKYSDVKLKSFVCKGDYGTREFRPAKYGAGDRNSTDLWDFGPNPPRHCSYAYHVPYGPYALTTSSERGSAVLADRNPWFDSPFEKGRDFSLFKPDVPPFTGTQEEARYGNAVAHYGDGQNVLFLDGHVGFERRSFCGANEDNIYTYWNAEDIWRGTPPKLGSQPADRLDSLLVNDPAVPR
ncbi:MAG: zinc-ribbon domain-containing protein [Planctomycetota bacterium]